MAKVKGPLFSMEASGAYGGALVFAQRMGKPVVRKLVTPSNPNAAGQETSRNRVRIMGAIQRWLNQTALTASGETETDKSLIAAICPAGQRWNSYLVDQGVGKGGVNYSAAETAWAGLDGTQQGAWDTAAGALTPAFNSVKQTEAGGGEITAASPGKVFFIMRYTLHLMGLADAPTATPPTYS